MTDQVCLLVLIEHNTEKGERKQCIKINYCVYLTRHCYMDILIIHLRMVSDWCIYSNICNYFFTFHYHVDSFQISSLLCSYGAVV